MNLLPASLTAQRRDALTAGLSGHGPPVDVAAPFTAEPLVTLPTTTRSDLDTAARMARMAQNDWAATDVRERAAVLLRLHDLILNRADDLLDVVQAETGKARGHAFEEVLDVANVCRYYGRVAPRLMGSRRRTGVFPLLTRAVEHHHPLGLIGLITPWNYPLTLGVADALPALVAGNAVLHKPDTQTTLSALFGRELAVEAGLPANLWAIVVGDGLIVGPWVIDTVDHISFTGSTPVGRTVAAQAGSRLIGAGLELGGKNAMIVCPDANVRAAAAGAVSASFSSAGQLCVSMERIYLHRDIADEFTAAFVASTAALTLGAGYDHRAQLGSLISAAQLSRVQADVKDAVAHGARILTGGKARPDLGPYFFEPTVLADVPPAARCHDEETFGPVVALYVVDSEDDAVDAANASRYGLNAAVWTRNHRKGQRIAARLHAGTVNINEGYAAAWGSVDAPMGGWGDSGLGRRHGADGILATTWSQTVALQHLWPVGEHGPLRGKRYQRAITVALRALKALHRR